ncbi:MAG TPA: hypothetical protein VFB88_19255, partial [Xanthobacteraceae bacterium]|nr:hypothetical protein [Xanthobacteraceae bacterium]
MSVNPGPPVSTTSVAVATTSREPGDRGQATIERLAAARSGHDFFITSFCRLTIISTRRRHTFSMKLSI